MEKRTMRAVSTILMLLMLIPMMFACSPNGETGSKDVVSLPVVNEEEKLVLPDSHDYSGEPYHILSAGNVGYDDFSFTAEDETVLGQAQYKRKEIILQEFGVEITIEKDVNKNSAGNGPGFQKIQKQVQGDDNTYQLGIIGGYDVAKLAENNLLHDINSVPWIETSKSWWDQNANNDLTINGMLFFTNGSLTAAYSESTFVIYLNKKLAEQHLQGVDLYQIVKDQKWTVDKLGEYSRTVSVDLDGDGVKGPKDRYGLYVWDDSMLGMMGAAGTKSATVNANGVIELTLYNDNTLNMFNKFTEVVYNKEYALTYQRYNSTQLGGGVIVGFQEDRALMWATSNVNTKNIRDMEASFGILPYPKLSEAQERYYSTIAPYNSQFICIPFTPESSRIEYVGAITEALAYYGKVITWPACYEQTMKGAFARDEGTMDMLDIIYGNYVYDIGYYYNVGKYTSGLMNLLRNLSYDFASTYEASKDSAQAQLDTINANYALVLGDWQEDK